MKTIQKYLILAPLIACLTISHASSTMMPKKFSWNAVPFDEIIKNYTETPSQKYKALWNEAQSTMGIPEHKRYELKWFINRNNCQKLVDQGSFYGTVGGLTDHECKTVLLAENPISFSSDTRLKRLLFHEAAHVKQKCESERLIPARLSLVLSSLALLCQCESKKNAGLFAGTMAVMGLSAIPIARWLLLTPFDDETDADTRSAHAFGCCACLRTTLNAKPSYELNAPSEAYAWHGTGAGYLTEDQFAKIANQMEREGKYCAEHKRDLSKASHWKGNFFNYRQTLSSNWRENL